MIKLTNNQKLTNRQNPQVQGLGRFLGNSNKVPLNRPNNQRQMHTNAKENLKVLQELFAKIPIPMVSAKRKFELFAFSCIVSAFLVWMSDSYQIRSDYEIITYFGIYSVLVFPIIYFIYCILPENRFLDITMIGFHTFSITLYKFIMCELNRKDEIIKNAFIEINRIWTKGEIKKLVIDIFTSKEYNLNVGKHSEAIKKIVENSHNMKDARKLTLDSIEKILNPDWTEILANKVWEIGINYVGTFVIIGIGGLITKKCAGFVYDQVINFPIFKWFWGGDGGNPQPPVQPNPNDNRLDHELFNSNRIITERDARLKREFTSSYNQLRNDVNGLEFNLKNQILGVAQRTDSNFNELKTRIDGMLEDNKKIGTAVNSLIKNDEATTTITTMLWDSVKLLATHINYELPDMKLEREQDAVDEQKRKEELDEKHA